jgi:hypothetical protein
MILHFYTQQEIYRTKKRNDWPARFVTSIANRAAAAAGIEPFTHGSIDLAMKNVIKARRNAGVQGRKSASAVE